MKKFIWISSYPKSGNTMLRLFLSAFFFTDNGIINSLKIIKHIVNFQSLILKLPRVPSFEDFKKDITKVGPLWLEAQKFHNASIKKSLFLKTHSFMGMMNSCPLTNSKFTRGFIYIVRDPRSVVISNMHHFNWSIDESINNLFDEKRFSLGSGAPAPEIISSWKNNYLSWKKFSNTVPGIIIKYEDILKNSKKEYLKILKFLQKIIPFEINDEKFNNAVKSVDFTKLKQMESNFGFDEKFHGEYFFRKGIADEWKRELSPIYHNKISSNLSNELKELGYLK